MTYDLIIVGSGSVGAAASFYAAKAGLKVLAIDSGRPPHDIGRSVTPEAVPTSETKQ